MQWTDIRRLAVGDRITFGDSAWTAKCTYTREGVVKHVTVKGGILVELLTSSGVRTSETQWVPYHHVISFPAGQMRRRRTKKARTSSAWK